MREYAKTKANVVPYIIKATKLAPHISNLHINGHTNRYRWANENYQF